MPLSRRDCLKALIASAPMSLASSAFAIPSITQAPSPWITKKGTIKIGLLWSLTGHLSVIEKASLDVGLFWINEVNKAGGIAGYLVEPVIIDANSDLKTYRQGISDLIQRENVLATFGGYTSASRRAVMPFVTSHRGLFYYPTCYAGRECWQNIICTGPIANQHSFDLIPYMVEKYGPRAYFVGSNYVWPKESNRNASQRLIDVQGELIGEAYMPLGQSYFNAIIDDIKQKSPDWIFSTVIGDSDIQFRKQYMEAGFRPETLPTASLTTSEIEVKRMGIEYGEGHILSAPYFQSLDNPTNRQFVNNFLGSAYGESGVTHFNMEETYLAFLYFKKAVEQVLLEEGRGALTPSNVRRYSAGLKLSVDESPEGEVWIDQDNFNSWLTPKIGRFNSEGQIDILSIEPKQSPPKPYLLYPDRGECKADGLHLPNGKVVKSAS
tara:strand:+ start:14189 stop:15499 length:1311 start_codon:yes stop_codon:yes gene_type:complete